ncbi:hypothetical protein CY34DRAFT_101346 [Suillus luteus UH-Slu-Lm8-n1]|uniref:Uncharacterized protein n=1 Tax=Suillus luteus UH-Slu-Lm8-n1 TaxID=930992 RepID=A0A0C9Z565_9AGAM|nr:hypothetical protein CY34DRAFT_101346 [Suillus luteus UH-Slu-Lm8-n1]
MTRHTDAGHAQIAKYVASKTVSHLNAAVEHFELVLDQCPASHPDHTAALTNLAWARLEGYIRKDLQDIDTTISLFRDALASRPQHHPDRFFSIYNLSRALIWRHRKKSTAADIREAAQLYHELLPLCPEGTYLRSIAAGAALHKLSRALESWFTQSSNIDDLDEFIQFRREAVSLCPEGHTDRVSYLNNLAVSLHFYHFKHQGNPNDLDEAISLHEEALRLCPVGHESRDYSMDNLGGVLVTRFNKRGAIDDITRAISLRREALTLRPPGHPHRDTTLSNLALALQKRYDKLDVSEDLSEATDLYRESLRIRRLDDPERHVTCRNLSSALCSRFRHTRKNEDVEEAIDLCQQSLEALPSLHPDRYFSYIWLKEAYLSRYRVQLNPADLSLAVENFRLASRHPTQGFPRRIIQAYNWTVAAEQHGHASALEAYTSFFEFLDDHLATRSSATSRREAAGAFHYARTLPVDAASCAIRCDNLRRAVELVEQGRGLQWSLASRLKTPVEDLESANPTLAHNYLELSKCISNTAQSSATNTERAAADRRASLRLICV